MWKAVKVTLLMAFLSFLALVFVAAGVGTFILTN